VSPVQSTIAGDVRNPLVCYIAIVNSDPRSLDLAQVAVERHLSNLQLDQDGDFESVYIAVF